jgi:hypothetical protein
MALAQVNKTWPTVSITLDNSGAKITVGGNQPVGNNGNVGGNVTVGGNATTGNVGIEGSTSATGGANVTVPADVRDAVVNGANKVGGVISGIVGRLNQNMGTP